MNTKTVKHTHKTPPTSCTASPASRDRDHTARCAITPLPPLCIHHSETNGLLALEHFNEPRGSAGAHLSAQFYFNSPPPTNVHTSTHKETEWHEKTLSLPNGIFHYEAGQTAQFSSSVPQKVRRELKSSQFGTSETKWRMTTTEIGMFMKRARI